MLVQFGCPCSKKIGYHWSSSSDELLTRLVGSLKQYPYSECLRRHGLPSLEYSCERDDVAEVFQILHHIDLGPVVQSIVSLKSLLRGQLVKYFTTL